MVWSAIAMTIGEQLLEVAAAAIIDAFSGNELQEAFDDAIEKIDLNTRRALEESTHKDLQAKLDGLVSLLREYNVAPTDWMLNAMTYDCRYEIVSRLKTLDLYDPNGRGLMGHPDFLIAAGLYTAILQQRIVAINEAEKKNLISFLSESIDHAEDMHTEWQEWNERRFGSLGAGRTYNWDTKGNEYTFLYTFDGKTMYAGTKFIFDDMPANLKSDTLDHAVEQAEQKRQQHIAAEWHKLEDAFITPSSEVVKKWRGLLAHMKLEMHLSESQMVQIGPSDELRKTMAEIKSQHLKAKPI